MGQPETEVDYPFAITSCGLLSSIGIGLEEFATAIQAGRSGRRSIGDLFEEPLPNTEACIISDFKARTFLGTKGTAFLDRTTALVMVASGMALQDGGWLVADHKWDRVGLVIGTSTGSVKSISDYARESLIQEKPYLVNPLIFPNTVMNCAAGQSAIRYGLKGINATVSGGQLSSLLALRYATVAIRQRYADVLIVGGVEEFSPQAAWGFHYAGNLRETETLLGEGCATFIVEHAVAARRAGRTPLAELLACEVGVYHEPENGPEGLARCIQHALRRAGVSPDQVGTVSGSMTGDRTLDHVEEEGIRLSLGRMPQRLLQVKKLLGECYSAAGVLQLAALLSLKQEDGSIALVTSVDHTGAVGCAVIRRCN